MQPSLIDPIAVNLRINKAEESLVYKHGYSRLTHLVLITGDLIFLNISFLIAYAVRFGENPFASLHEPFLALMVVSNLAWLACVYLFNIYAISRLSRWENIIWNMIKSITFHFLLISMYVLTVKGYYFPRGFFFAHYGILTFNIFLCRLSFVLYIRQMRKTGYHNRNVVIVGTNQASFKIYNYFLSDSSQSFNLKAVFSDSIGESKHGKVDIFPENDLLNYLSSNPTDELYCALPLTEVNRIREIMSYCDNNLVRFRYVPDFRALLYKKVDIDFYGQVPVLTVRKEPLENIINMFIKRAFDIVFSLCVLAFFVPFVFPVIAVLIKMQSKGPIFFKQLRSGRNNKVFYCYKFRTMVVNQASDKQQATKNDARITPIGRFLRKSNLDEIPQFLNVLKGDMSVIGPRPHMVKHTEEFKETVDKFMVRHFVKPGITGWAQVNGFRGATETPQKIIKRARYDVWYIENWSLMLDLKIVIMTVLNTIKGEKNAF